ncbi:MAG: LPS assembly protein LptD [Thiohalocapsa sp. PB-PSB1]|nr:MAG: hypothetical protein N838_12370 [Thiohalocapsa sp. PB-PSB1]QQO53214.1 MAG: LPS assembly protein LptD [Thiohalocapsa sp. PB-PSB1]
MDPKLRCLLALAGILLGAGASAEPTEPLPNAPPSALSVDATDMAAGTPAIAPPPPNVLDQRTIPAVVSPYAARSAGIGALDLSERLTQPVAPAFSPDTGDAPLWVLPTHLISESTRSAPGADMIRDRGYLDTPATIGGLSRETIEPNSGRLDAGLGWDYCGPRPRSMAPALNNDPGASLPGSGPIELDAGGVSYQRNTQIISAAGGVKLARTGQQIEADHIRYNRGTGDLSTRGETYLEYPGLRILGGEAEFNLQRNTGHIDNARFRLSGPINLRGRASVAHVDSPKQTRYEDLIYTSCPPGSNAWTLRARKLRLDQNSGRGIANHARLRIRGIPVLYTPYLNFPIDDRRTSGFLMPSFGSSDDNGFELITPYYWNIAPNLDATFFPRYMSQRGLMLGGEFRYLTKRDKGTITGEIIPSDTKYQDGGTRGALSIDQQGRFLRRLLTEIDYSIVSDDQYLEDLGNNIEATSTRRLTQRGDVTYVGKGWSLLTSVQAFQELDQTTLEQARPYQRMPQLLLRINPRTFGSGLIASLDAEYDFFDHPAKVYGHRFATLPSLSWPLRRSFGHLIPSARVHLASYDLSDPEGGQPENPSHSIPSFDLDSKLIFERSSSWLGEPAIQTLEPRLFYLYTPYVDQEDTPVFDSSELSFSFSNLFRNNRFTGRDRIGDANQVTAALTSRTLRSATGEELFRFSLGQIFYFSDRRVQIFGPEETTQQSPYTGEFSANLFEHWFGRASFEWDPQLDQDQWQRRTLQLEYRHPDHRLLNMAYRADDSATPANRYEDTDFSFRLPVGQRVELVGRWLYSILHGETMDAFAGIEYGKCCWRIRLLGRHFKRSPDDVASNSIMLQLELAGLGAIGNPVGKLLEQEVYGYQID